MTSISATIEGTVKITPDNPADLQSLYEFALTKSSSVTKNDVDGYIVVIESDSRAIETA
jgi:hypothetical protein